MMKISLSFKENEQEIFDYIKSKLSSSIYLKELVLADMKKNDEVESKPTKKSANGIEW